MGAPYLDPAARGDADGHAPRPAAKASPAPSTLPLARLGGPSTRADAHSVLLLAVAALIVYGAALGHLGRGRSPRHHCWYRGIDPRPGITVPGQLRHHLVDLHRHLSCANQYQSCHCRGISRGRSRIAGIESFGLPPASITGVGKQLLLRSPFSEARCFSGTPAQRRPVHRRLSAPLHTELGQ